MLTDADKVNLVFRRAVCMRHSNLISTEPNTASLAEVNQNLFVEDQFDGVHFVPEVHPTTQELNKEAHHESSWHYVSH